MKKLLPSLFSMLFSVLAMQTGYAGHNRGAEITYINVAPNTYAVKLNYYKDCGTVAAPTSQSLSY
ncbi:MAG: hypothetical protein LPK21_01755, partial [Hymenobacteraceae bacterium]|nr:hypothetical protein [Hymenobacteraceae bacterium]